MPNLLPSLPARLPTPSERELLAEWISAAGDIHLAYISTRFNDDPALRNRIVIVADPGAGPSYLLHASAGRNIWIVLTLGNRTKVRRFKTLRAALNSVRPVLIESSQIEMRLKTER